MRNKNNPGSNVEQPNCIDEKNPNHRQSAASDPQTRRDTTGQRRFRKMCTWAGTIVDCLAQSNNGRERV